MKRIIRVLVLSICYVGALCIPTTLEGPFKPVTVPVDPSLRAGTGDLPATDPRLQRKRPVSFPEQISLSIASPSSVWISWISGDYQMGKDVIPLNTSQVTSIVQFGTEPKSYKFTAYGSPNVYSQLYPFEGLLNYTSAYIHHVQLKELRSYTKYYYRCGSSLEMMSEELEFTTMPSPSASAYPAKVAVVGDLGLTYNSSTTIEHVRRNDPSLLLMVGDLTYADQYITNGTGSSCFSCSFPDAPIRETYQPHWDHWGRFMEPLVSKVPMMVIEGNHEIEPQIFGKTFESYNARFAVPSEESGSKSSLYYSFNAGGIHFIMLGAYVDFNKTGSQYAWLKQDLEKVDRGVTPWVIASWHAPWYNSYSSHYREAECMKIEMEDLLYKNGIDIVFNGHVHAYERMNRVYNYQLDKCGPVYITIGDGGNIERVDVEHADDPGKCPKPTDNTPQYGGICAKNFTSGPAANQFCYSSQPEWSAVRDGSFGHGILEVKNATYALWTWYRNQDTYRDDHLGDQIYIVRTPELCNISTPRVGNGSTPSISSISTPTILLFQITLLLCVVVML